MDRLSSPTEVIYKERRPTLVLRSAMLRVTRGLDLGKSCKMELSRVRVGTDLDNDLVLTDPRVSRSHFELRVQETGHLLVDLASTNGTYHGKARVREAWVGPGATIQLGDTTLVLEDGAESSQRVRAQEAFGGLIGKSLAMQELFGLLAAVAPSDATVLIEGETGTGKELVAEEIHRASPRGQHPFRVVDCAAIPAELMESELFGHERGAFSGADRVREGMFERAHGGTVFLDEIGELPLELQSRLLRVLDRRTIRRLGSNTQRKVDVRVVAATHRDLDKQVNEGVFRQDLFYRLAVVRVQVPALRERREDIAPLARQFLWRAGRADSDQVLTPQVLKVLQSRSWPGNVRELRNVMEKAMVLATADKGPAEIEGLLQDAPSPPSRQRTTSKATWSKKWLARTLPEEMLDLPYKELKEKLVGQLEALYLSRLYKHHGDNISSIARDAGIDRHMVRQLLRKHGIKK